MIRKVFLLLLISQSIIFSLSCTNQANTPKVETKEITNISSASAIGLISILDDGGSKINSAGVCWNLTGNPSTSDYRTVNPATVGDLKVDISGLKPGTKYFVRAYATNQEGTAYGNTIEFTTKQELPKLSDINFILVDKTEAQCSASIISDGEQKIVSKGFCWSKNQEPTINDNKVESNASSSTFTCSIKGLEPGTQYYIRAFATSSSGTAYSQERTFTTSDAGPSIVDNDHLLLGNPSNATANIVYANNYLMTKSQYVLSYNNSKQTANWVAWHLNTSWMGSVPRQNDFRADETLPAEWHHVTESDFYYSQYGFDRGHMCPSADRTKTIEDNSATFYMTNMVPQSPNNNQKVWADLENYCRDLAESGSELYIFSGPWGEGGTSSKGTFTVLKSGVVVPELVWKIALVIPDGNNDLYRISESTRVIAVVIPNNQECSQKPWTSYRVSVDSIESLTGYDFFTNIPTEIQDAIEAKVDNL